MKSTLIGLFLVMLTATLCAAADEEVITPDRPEYIQLMTDELLEVTFIEDPVAKAQVFTVMAERRIREMEKLQETHRPEYTADLMQAYADILNDGFAPALMEAHGTGRDTGEAARRFKETTERHVAVLRGLSSGLPDEAVLPGAEQALAACRDSRTAALCLTERRRITAEEVNQVRNAVRNAYRQYMDTDEAEHLAVLCLASRVTTEAAVRIIDIAADVVGQCGAGVWTATARPIVEQEIAAPADSGQPAETTQQLSSRVMERIQMRLTAVMDENRIASEEQRVREMLQRKRNMLKDIRTRQQNMQQHGPGGSGGGHH